MPAYDAQRFDPPAPLAAVVLRARDRRKSLSGVAMQIDSGADVTAIPAASVNQLGLEADEHRRYELMAFDGTRRVANSVQCDLVFLGQVYRGTYVIVEGDYGILGRDVLNQISLVLDGPRLEWREEHALE